jgi:opacity protein-like surface antigen
VAYAVEAGYNVFSQIPKLKDSEKLYVFGRFEHYNSMASGTYASMYKYTKKYRCAFGVNYSPVKQITIKGEYSYRFFEKPDNNGLASDSPLYKQPYNNEPSVSIGVTYSGWFL